MTFDEMLGGLVPKKPESQKALVLSNQNSIPELYDQWYGLHIKKYELQQRSRLNSDVSFKVIEDLASRLSSDQNKTDSTGLAKVDTFGQLAQHKENIQNNINTEIYSIDDHITEIKSAIKFQAEYFLNHSDMKLDLVLTLYSGHTAGKLELSTLNVDMGVPLYYLFNDEIPIFRVGDKNIIQKLSKHLSEETIANIKSMIPEPKSTNESNQPTQIRSRRYSKYSNFESIKPLSTLPKYDPFIEHAKNYLSECFGLQIRGNYSIPMFTSITQPEQYFSDKQAKAYRLILINQGIVSVEKTSYHDHRGEDKDLSEIEILHKKNPIFQIVDFNKDSFTMRIKPGIYNTDKDSLIEASGWILAKFAKYGLTKNIRFRETILHMNDLGHM